MMVNYLYRPEDIIANHEAFAHQGKIIASKQAEARVKPRRGKRAT